MSACQEVSRWITENVLVPVERFITEAREACEEVKRWVEEQVWQPFERWASREERKCIEQDCNWWCLCCNKWVCWIVSIVVRIIVWVLVTVGKWIAYLVCKIVTVVIGIIIELVLKVIHRVVSFVVCLFTDFGQALKTIWDLWNDIIDTIGDIFELAISLLDDIIGIINDVDKLISGIGKSFCILGDGICRAFGAIIGLIRGIIHWGRNIVDWLRDTISGIKDLVTGILTLNLCDIQRGLGVLNIFRVIPSVFQIFGGWFYGGPREQLSQNNLNSIITEILQNSFSNYPDRIERSKNRARIHGSPVGLPVQLAPRRMAIRSSEFLRQLHLDGILNLHSIAGRVSDCQGKFIYDQFEGEVVYVGTETTVSQSDLDTFISLGADAVAAFTVYPIKRSTYRRYLDLARRKGFQIGLNFTWTDIKEVFIEERQFIPMNDGTMSSGNAQTNLLRLIGRNGDNDDLTTVPIIAIFGYVIPSLHGLATGNIRGVTFRTRFPEVGFRFVMIHEIGHYFGLDHPRHNSMKDIMWSPRESGNDWAQTIGEFGFVSGEANFTEQDARDVWNWLTSSPQNDQFLP